MCITSRKGLNLGRVGPQTTELFALERLKCPHRLINGKMVSPSFLGCLWCDPFDTCM